MAIGNIDLNQEIESWKSAVYGKDVRSANVAAFEKIQGTVNDTVQNVNQAAEDSASAAHNAQAAVDSIQAAVTTATGKAAEAENSATAAAGSQAAAASSKTAAAQAATDALTAKTAAEAARDATEHIAGFDGTAASVKATDTYGLVVDALGESTTQALIDAVANKVINELIAKSNIVNNLLATEVGTVLSGALGPIIDQRLTDLMNKYTQLNGEMESLLLYFGYGGYSESPIESFKRCFGQLPARRISIGHVANANYAAGFVCFKYNDTAGSAILFTYSDAYPNIMYARLVSGAWVDS